jgi:multiple sugar transport system permease protein
MNGLVGKKVLLQPCLWLLPFFSLFFFCMLFPWIWSFIISLFKWNPLRRAGAMSYVGIGNYLNLLGDTEFWRTVLRTLGFTAANVVISFCYGLGLALLLNSKIRFKAFYRVMILLPMMMTPAVVALMWRLILQTDWGLANQVLRAVGLAPVQWLSQPALTPFIIVGFEVWLSTPMNVVLFLAGLQNLPRELIEAARIDGASQPRIIISVIIPWLSPVILIVLFFRIVFSLRMFAAIYALYVGAGPAGSGRVLGIYLYEMLRGAWEIGSASALSYIFLLLTFLVALPVTIKVYKGMTVQ